MDNISSFLHFKTLVETFCLKFGQIFYLKYIEHYWEYNCTNVVRFRKLKKYMRNSLKINQGPYYMIKKNTNFKNLCIVGILIFNSISSLGVD